MAIKEIVQVPNTILRKVSREVTSISEAQKIGEDLINTLESSKVPGAGLSAPQIGINERIFVARRFFLLGQEEKHEDIIMINPVIKKVSKKMQNSLEGCLSIKDTYGYVKRHKNLRVEYTDLEGTKKVIIAEGFFANVIQHEQDHLDGILFIDKLINDKSYTEKEIDKILNKS